MGYAGIENLRPEKEKATVKDASIATIRHIIEMLAEDHGMRIDNISVEWAVTVAGTSSDKVISLGIDSVHTND